MMSKSISAAAGLHWSVILKYSLTIPCFICDAPGHGQRTALKLQLYLYCAGPALPFARQFHAHPNGHLPCHSI